jgi:hypothetical protein
MPPSSSVFGSIKQDDADVQFSGLKTIGGIVDASPIYVVQDGSKLTTFWADGHVQILVKVKIGGRPYRLRRCDSV